MIRDVRDVIVARFQLEAELSMPPSATGGQLEAAKLGLASRNDDAADWRRATTSDNRSIRFADAVAVMSDLTPLELEACRLRYWVPLDGHDRFLRNVPDDSLKRVQIGEREEKWRPVNKPPEYVTMLDIRATEDGDEEKHQAYDEHGPVAGRVLVEAVRVRLTSFETIGKRLGISPRQADTLLRKAIAKVQLRLDLTRGGHE